MNHQHLGFRSSALRAALAAPAAAAAPAIAAAATVAIAFVVAAAGCSPGGVAHVNQFEVFVGEELLAPSADVPIEVWLLGMPPDYCPDATTVRGSADDVAFDVTRTRGAKLVPEAPDRDGHLPVVCDPWTSLSLSLPRAQLDDGEVALVIEDDDTTVTALLELPVLSLPAPQWLDPTAGAPADLAIDARHVSDVAVFATLTSGKARFSVPQRQDDSRYTEPHAVDVEDDGSAVVHFDVRDLPAGAIEATVQALFDADIFDFTGGGRTEIGGDAQMLAHGTFITATSAPLAWRGALPGASLGTGD